MHDRTPVAVAYDDGMVVVVCDDGTVWHRTLTTNDAAVWTRVPHPIPGSSATVEKQRTRMI